MALPQPPPLPQTAICYRHPNREAGRRCTRCGNWACSECLVQASVGSHCVDCAKAERPNVATRARYWNARQPTLVTYTLIGMNVAVFVLMAILDSRSLSGAVTGRSPDEIGLWDLGLAGPFLADGQWYRLVSTGFIHFGIFHLAVNMLVLFQLGQLLEPAIGRVRFTLLYFAALLAGSAGVLLLDPTSIAGGASGAVFGLMGAAFVALRNRGVNPFSTGLGVALVLNLMITFTFPGISIGAHLGGIVGGALAGWVALPPRYARIPAWATYAAPVAIMVVAVVVSVLSVQTA